MGHLVTESFGSCSLFMQRHAFVENMVSSFLLFLQMEQKDREKEMERKGVPECR